MSMSWLWNKGPNTRQLLRKISAIGLRKILKINNKDIREIYLTLVKKLCCIAKMNWSKCLVSINFRMASVYSIRVNVLIFTKLSRLMEWTCMNLDQRESWLSSNSTRKLLINSLQRLNSCLFLESSLICSTSRQFYLKSLWLRRNLFSMSNIILNVTFLTNSHEIGTHIVLGTTIRLSKSQINYSPKSKSCIIAWRQTSIWRNWRVKILRKLS